MCDSKHLIQKANTLFSLPVNVWKCEFLFFKWFSLYSINKFLLFNYEKIALKQMAIGLTVPLFWTSFPSAELNNCIWIIYIWKQITH